MVSMEVIQGTDKGRVFRLDEDEQIVGRESPTVPLTDSTVSRQHARLSHRNGTWMIEDLGSVNGTFLNGLRVNKPLPMSAGDQIRVGRTLLVFGSGAAAAAPLDVDENGQFLEASITATVPASGDSVIIPTPEAGAEAIGTLRVLYKLSTELSSIFTLDALLRRTLDLIFEVVKAERGYILLIGEDGAMIPMAARTQDDAAAVQMPISRTIINEVLDKQVGVISSNAMRDKRFSSGKSVHDFGIRQAICVPLKGRAKITGVIHVDSSVANRLYSTEELRLLTAIGYQTGLAVDNVRLYEAAVQSERLAAVGETVALLSHYIKNILQGLLGGTDVVERALGRENLAQARQGWPIVRRSLDRINGLILNMLAFTKPRQPLLESVNVNHVLTECVDLIASQADERNVAIMPDLDEVPPIPADPDGLHQAFLNLLSNALDAVDAGQGVVILASEYDSMNRQVVVRVADNGVGIGPDQIGRIFEAFHSTKGHKGTGLGLAVTRKIIEEHRGRIDVESSPGQGTTFTVRLATQPGGIRSSDETQTP